MTAPSRGSQGTHASDGFRQGYQQDSRYEYGNPGTPIAPDRLWDVVPVAFNTTGLSAANIISAGAYAPLRAGTGVTQIQLGGNGAYVYQLDIPRNITIGGNSSTVAANFFVFGYDIFNNLLVEKIVGPVGATLVSGKKTFNTVTAVWCDTATVGTITVGFGDVVGLPIVLNSKNYVSLARWNGADIALTAVTVADATNPATDSTGDVKGTITLPSSSDGTKRLTVKIVAVGSIGPQNLAAVNGVPQYTRTLF